MTTTAKQAAHTPGPWIVCINSLDDRLCIEQDRAAMEASGNHEEPTVVVGCVDDMGDGLNREIGEANARLIAAAPDLLASLARVLTAFARRDSGARADRGGAIASARAAIDKARP